MWLEHQKQEEIEKTKQDQVRARLHSWTLDKSRHDSETLRKRESTQLAAGLDKYCQGEYEAVDPSCREHAGQMHRSRNNGRATMSQAWPSSTMAEKSASKPQKELSPILADNDNATMNELHSKSDQVPLAVIKKKRPPSQPSTPLTSSGFHFRNSLPVNFALSSRKSSNSTTPSSKEGRSSGSTPKSTSSSTKLLVLDEAAGMGSMLLSDLPSAVDLFALNENESPQGVDNDDKDQHNQHSPPRNVVSEEAGFRFQPFSTMVRPHSESSSTTNSAGLQRIQAKVSIVSQLLDCPQ